MILIDAGVPGQWNKFLKSLESTGTKPEEIDLVVITHGHMDHIGMAEDIKELTSAKIAIHHQDKDRLESGKSPMPPGLTLNGKFLSFLAKPMSKIALPIVNPDIVLSDEGMSLGDFDIPGSIVHTPGHTEGSVSVILETGETFVGDLAMSAKFMRLTPGVPIFGDDIDVVKRSWQKLLDLGAKTIYPAHGKPFSADVFRHGIIK